MPTLVEHQMPARVEATLLIVDLVKQQEGETIQKRGLETENDTESGLKSVQKIESNQKSNQKILEAISKNSVITIKELQELTGLSESGVKKMIPMNDSSIPQARKRKLGTSASGTNPTNTADAPSWFGECDYTLKTVMFHPSNSAEHKAPSPGLRTRLSKT